MARARKTIVNYAIEGVVVSTGVDDEGAGASVSSVVYVSGYEEADRMDRSEDFDQRSVCYIDSDRRPEAAWRTNIYIERFIFRHLVELYASRRIDSGEDFDLAEGFARSFRSRRGAGPEAIHVLRTAGDRLRQHSRAHLVSVQTSLRGGPLVDPEVLPLVPLGRTDGPAAAGRLRPLTTTRAMGLALGETALGPRGRASFRWTEIARRRSAGAPLPIMGGKTPNEPLRRPDDVKSAPHIGPSFGHSRPRRRLPRAVAI